jgi:Ca-activated chloride channel family protein
MITDVEADGQQSATSPSMAIRRLKLDPAGDRRLNRDFILRFNVTTPSLLTASLVLSDDQGGDSQEGTWQLTLIAPQGGGNGGAAPHRDVAFVIDRSGSMGGWKMVAAHSATARVVSRSSYLASISLYGTSSSSLAHSSMYIQCP